MSEEQQDDRKIILPSEAQQTEAPSELGLVQLTNMVVFPMSVVPIRAKETSEVKLLDDAAKSHRIVALVAKRKSEENEEDPSGNGRRESVEDAYEIGSIARILQLQHLPDGSMNVLFQALQRFRIKGVVRREPYIVTRVERLDQPAEDFEELEPLATTVRNQMKRLISLNPNMPENASAVIDSVDDPGLLADLVAANLSIGIPEKQKLLETLEREQRLQRLTHLLAHEVNIAEISEKIQSDVKSSIEDSQREYYLRQQLRAIKEELGETEGEKPELQEYRERIEGMELREEVRKEALRELDRLEKMNEASPEYHILTTYIEWIVDLPWNTATEDNLEIERAQQVLDEDHHGLEKVKRRIIEYLSVRKLKPDAPGPILCFVGPPGVGKTSLGQSIARTVGRNFVRMSLGGMRDEAEIRGHRRTYVGAMPGRIIQSVRKAGSNNPVFMLDEIDKVGSDFRGDPSSALLEVLDPAQNDTFVDLYLNVPFDLSNVMFIATANVLDTIPWALRDRMEIIQIPGYTLEEKLQIAQKYLVPRQIDANGLKKSQISIHKSALRNIISEYTREAGVRNLEREIGSVCRGAAVKIARGETGKVTVSKDDLREYLEKPRVFREMAERTSMPGVATGLAWTATGGDILFIEATRMPGKGNLTLTGQLGDVMRESAQTVISYVRANVERLGVDKDFFSESDIHIHVPAGAVPKDGPSAGVAMLTAVVSLLLGKKIRDRVAMTGEITLRGLVMPVGGIKEKVLAASRSGIKEVILPERAELDLDDVPESARSKMKVHLVKHMDEVLDIALGLDL